MSELCALHGPSCWSFEAAKLPCQIWKLRAWRLCHAALQDTRLLPWASTSCLIPIFKEWQGCRGKFGSKGLCPRLAPSALELALPYWEDAAELAAVSWVGTSCSSWSQARCARCCQMLMQLMWGTGQWPVPAVVCDNYLIAQWRKGQDKCVLELQAHPLAVQCTGMGLFLPGPQTRSAWTSCCEAAHKPALFFDVVVAAAQSCAWVRMGQTPCKTGFQGTGYGGNRIHPSQPSVAWAWLSKGDGSKRWAEDKRPASLWKWGFAVPTATLCWSADASRKRVKRSYHMARLCLLHTSHNRGWHPNPEED